MDIYNIIISIIIISIFKLCYWKHYDLTLRAGMFECLKSHLRNAFALSSLPFIAIALVVFLGEAALDHWLMTTIFQYLSLVWGYK